MAKHEQHVAGDCRSWLDNLVLFIAQVMVQRQRVLKHLPIAFGGEKAKAAG